MKLTRKSAGTNFAHFVSKVILFMLKGRELHSRCSDLAEMQTPIRCVYVVVNLNYENDPNFLFLSDRLCAYAYALMLNPRLPHTNPTLRMQAGLFKKSNCPSLAKELAIQTG